MSATNEISAANPAYGLRVTSALATTPGGSSLYPAVRFRQGIGSNSLQGWAFQAQAPSPFGASFSVPFPILVGNFETVNPLKIPVPSKIVAKEKSYVEIALKAVTQEISDVQAFIKNPSQTTLTSKINKHLNRRFDNLEKSLMDQEFELKKTNEAIFSLEKDIEVYKEDLKKAQKAATQNLINKKLAQPKYNADLANLKSSVQKLNASITDLKSSCDSIKGFIQGTQSLLIPLLKEFDPILVSLETQKATLEGKAKLRANLDQKSISLAEWLQSIQFFEELKVKNPPSSSSLPAWHVTSLSEAGSDPVIQLGVSPDGDSHEVLMRLVFDDAGNQLGIQSSDCVPTHAVQTLAPKILDPEYIQAFPEPITTLDATTPWDDLKIKAISDAAKKALQDKNPALVKDITNNGFNILLMKFRKSFAKSPKIGEDMWSEHSERAGITSVYMNDPTNATFYSYKQPLVYIENSALFLRVAPICHSVGGGEGIFKLADEVNAAGNAILKTFS